MTEKERREKELQAWQKALEEDREERDALYRRDPKLYEDSEDSTEQNSTEDNQEPENKTAKPDPLHSYRKKPYEPRDPQKSFFDREYNDILNQ